jgi:cyclic beta-1,2-glucan synthetase
VLSGAAQPQRAVAAMTSMRAELVRPADALALLFAPPFDRTPKDPGYIKGYPPGVRENGGQYSHAAMWSVLALAKLGEGDNAADLFALLNPINHALTPAAVEQYKVEPYVVAADIYSVAPHVGRGGWTWYTGAAGWMYQAGIEGILGIRREGASLVIAPCIPAHWPGYEATVQVDGTSYEIHVAATAPPGQGPAHALLDEQPLPVRDGEWRVPLDGGRHALRLAL